jgi:hypothetical protein
MSDTYASFVGLACGLPASAGVSPKIELNSPTTKSRQLSTTRISFSQRVSFATKISLNIRAGHQTGKPNSRETDVVRRMKFEALQGFFVPRPTPLLTG